MIPVMEIRALVGEWQLREDVVEKDYVLGWLIAAIAAHPSLSSTWIFKGGTCLRKCYYETYRFSEDLDFTVIDGGPEEPGDLQGVFGEISAWLANRCGLELTVDGGSFARRQNKRGHPTTLGRLAFRGPRGPRNLPKVRLDITSDEVLVQPVAWRATFHPYSDAPEPLATVACYSIVELLGEKLRALAERCRPRDLYDCVHLYRHPDLLGQADAVRAVLQAKCASVGIHVPGFASLQGSPYRAEIETQISVHGQPCCRRRRCRLALGEAAVT